MKLQKKNISFHTRKINKNITDTKYIYTKGDYRNTPKKEQKKINDA